MTDPVKLARLQEVAQAMHPESRELMLPVRPSPRGEVTVLGLCDECGAHTWVVGGRCGACEATAHLAEWQAYAEQLESILRTRSQGETSEDHRRQLAQHMDALDLLREWLRAYPHQDHPSAQAEVRAVLAGMDWQDLPVDPVCPNWGPQPGGHSGPCRACAACWVSTHQHALKRLAAQAQAGAGDQA